MLRALDTKGGAWVSKRLVPELSLETADATEDKTEDGGVEEEVQVTEGQDDRHSDPKVVGRG